MSDNVLSESRQWAFAELMDDPSASVQKAVYEELRSSGAVGIQFLRMMLLDGTPEQKLVARNWLEELDGKVGSDTFLDFIHRFQYELESGCLLLDRTYYPHFNPRQYYTFMNEASKYCRELMVTPCSGLEACKVLNRVLFHEYGFRGDMEHYYQPENSFLHQVVTRRKGIPITLSIIYILLAERCGLQLEPIGLPGHFLVGCFEDDEPFYIDVFARGKILNREAIENYLESHAIPVDEAYFYPLTCGQILTRCCRNLAHQFSRSQEPELEALYDGFVRAFYEAYRKHA